MIDTIFDTDLGDDIDDTWALGMLLKSPYLNLKYISISQGNVELKAKLTAAFLSECGRTDIPIGLGRATTDEAPRQYCAAAQFDMSAYRGIVEPDCAAGILRVLSGSDSPVTVIAAAPCSNIAEALRRQPEAAGRMRVFGMLGSVYRGYDGVAEPSDEYNVCMDIPACRDVFAQCQTTITPLDSCGEIYLEGERYSRVARSADPITRAIIYNYYHWYAADEESRELSEPAASSCLFDAVAVYMAELAAAENGDDGGLLYSRLPLIVDNKGFTRVAEGGNLVDVALGWRDKDRFLDHLTTLFS